MAEEREYACVGICLPDEDEAYCIGCGRPWGVPQSGPKPEAQSSEPPGEAGDMGAMGEKVGAGGTAPGNDNHC